MKKLVLLIGGLGVAGSAVALIALGIITVPFGPLAAKAAGAEAPKPPVTVMYPTKERIVNLADPGTLHYLKVEVTLEFIDHSLQDPPKGEAVKAQQDNFVKDMAAYAPVIEDRLNTVLSSKTTTELLTTEGKERLKQELMAQVNAALHDGEQVVHVYLPTFIIQ